MTHMSVTNPSGILTIEKGAIKPYFIALKGAIKFCC